MKHLPFLSLAILFLAACTSSTNLTQEFVPANLTQRLSEIRTKDNPNLVITLMDSVTTNEVVWISYKESQGDSSRMYTVAYGMPNDFGMTLPEEFSQIPSQIRHLGTNPKLIPGEVKYMGILEDGSHLYYVNDIIDRKSQMETNGSFVLLSNYKWFAPDEPLIQSNCALFSEEEINPQTEYPDCGSGTFSTFEVINNNIAIRIFNVLADAQGNNWGSMVSDKTYKWSGEQFFLVGDQVTPDADISEDNSFGNLLAPFVDITSLLIEEIEGEWVIQEICLGGIPNIRIFIEEDKWYFREAWYQDAMDYEIRAVDVRDENYELLLKNSHHDQEDEVIVVLNYDNVNDIINFGNNRYAMNPEKYPRIKEECEEMN